MIKRNGRWHHSVAENRKVALAMMGNRNPAKRKEVREQISLTLRKYSTPAQRKRWKAEKTLKELRATSKKEYRMEISRRISVGRKKAWRDPVIYRHMVDGMKKAWKRDYKWRAALQKNPKLRAKISKTMKGRDPIGRPRGPRVVWYVGKCGRIAMRSKPEVAYAKLLDKANVKWLYEYCTFSVGKKMTWTPDFYLPLQKKFVEIKGWLLSWVKRKIERVIQRYGATSFELIHSDTVGVT